MRQHSVVVRLAMLVALCSLSAPARAQVPGGGPAKTDCYVEWSGITPNKGKNLDCQDGDPSCDVDTTQNGVCVLGVGVCVAQTNVPECTPQQIDKVTVKAQPKTVKLGSVKIPVSPPVPPLTPITAPTCSAESIIRLPLKVTKKGTLKPSTKITLTATAIASAKPKKDKDILKIRCVPNNGGGECPVNAAGGPRELQLLAASAGTDLDNGWTGSSHNFPVVSNSELRVCLTGCGATSNPQCGEDEGQTAAVNGATFGAPLPLLASGVPVCVVNSFTGSKITGFTADMSTGAIMGGLVNLSSGVFLTSATQVCPRCSGSDVGQAGTCDSGGRSGRACTTSGVVNVANAAGNKTYTLSADCPPSGSPAGSIPIGLPLTTATSTLSGAPPCAGQTQLLPTGCGTCDSSPGASAACTGAACVGKTPAGECIDVKGGISQNCCTGNTSTPCFPNPIVRTGSTTPPAPAFPDPTFPKTGNVTVVGTYCESSSGSSTVDLVTGLPGPGAIVLPMAATWIQ
jgi:hypothetical protein